jgi:hypothetical protein
MVYNDFANKKIINKVKALSLIYNTIVNSVPRIYA